MYMLVNTKNNVVTLISASIETHEQGFFIGDVIWPNPDNVLAVVEVEDAACEGIRSQQYCYTIKKGFYLNPAFTANSYIDELEKTKAEKQSLLQELQQVKEELETLKGTLELQSDIVSD